MRTAENTLGENGLWNGVPFQFGRDPCRYFFRVDLKPIPLDQVKRIRIGLDYRFIDYHRKKLFLLSFFSSTSSLELELVGGEEFLIVGAIVSA